MNAQTEQREKLDTEANPAWQVCRTNVVAVINNLDTWVTSAQKENSVDVGTARGILRELQSALKWERSAGTFSSLHQCAKQLGELVSSYPNHLQAIFRGYSAIPVFVGETPGHRIIELFRKEKEPSILEALRIGE